MNKKKKNRIVKLTQFHTNIDFTAFSTTVCYRVMFGFIAMHILYLKCLLPLMHIPNLKCLVPLALRTWNAYSCL